MKNKKIKELRLGVGTDLSVSPRSGIGNHMGGLNISADDYFGGVMGIGRIMNSENTEEELSEEDIDDILLQEIDIKIPSLKSLLSTVGNIPVFGSIPNAISFLMSYFGPGGIRSSLTSFTKRLGMLFDKDLGEDILEPEYSDVTSRMSKSDLEKNLSQNIMMIKKELLNNPAKEKAYEKLIETIPKSSISKDNIPLSEKLSLNEIRDTLKKFDDILDELQYCITAFFKIFQGFFAKISLSFIEPIDFLNWLTSVYIENYFEKMKQAFELPIIKELAGYIGKPLNAIGHFDIFVNIEKLNRLKNIQTIISGLKQVRLVIERKNDIGSPDKNQKNISYGTNFLLQQIFETKTNYSLNILMEEYLNEDFEEEQFEKIDLEEELEEFSSVAGGSIQGATGPLGREKEKNIKNYIQKEQIEWVRRMDMYHKKTTNRLK